MIKMISNDQNENENECNEVNQYSEEQYIKEWLIEYEKEHKEEYNEEVEYLFIRLKVLMDKNDFEEMTRLI